MPDEVPKPPYPRPPIEQAVFAFHFAHHLERRAVERFVKKNRKAFPAQEQMFDIKVELGKKPSPASVSANGFILKDADNAITLVVRPETISVVRRPPYTAWDELIEHAKLVWRKIKDVAGHPQLSRLSTRFINRLDIGTRVAGSAEPLKSVNLTDYLQFGIVIPPGLADFPLENFHINCHASSPTGTLKQTIQVASIPSLLIDHTSFILDIDVATTEPIPLEEAAMWQIAQTLQERKNRLFEACITDTTRRLFK